MVLLLGVVRSLGDEGVTVGVLADLSSIGLHLSVDVLGTGVLFFGLRGGIDLRSGGGKCGGCGSWGISLGLVVVF